MVIPADLADHLEELVRIERLIHDAHEAMVVPLELLLCRCVGRKRYWWNAHLCEARAELPEIELRRVCAVHQGHARRPASRLRQELIRGRDLKHVVALIFKELAHK